MGLFHSVVQMLNILPASARPNEQTPTFPGPPSLRVRFLQNRQYLSCLGSLQSVHQELKPTLAQPRKCWFSPFQVGRALVTSTPLYSIKGRRWEDGQRCFPSNPELFWGWQLLLSPKALKCLGWQGLREMQGRRLAGWLPGSPELLLPGEGARMNAEGQASRILPLPCRRFHELDP